MKPSVLPFTYDEGNDGFLYLAGVVVADLASFDFSCNMSLVMSSPNSSVLVTFVIVCAGNRVLVVLKALFQIWPFG